MRLPVALLLSIGCDLSRFLCTKKGDESVVWFVLFASTFLAISLSRFDLIGIGMLNRDQHPFVRTRASSIADFIRRLKGPSLPSVSILFAIIAPTPILPLFRACEHLRTSATTVGRCSQNSFRRSEHRLGSGFGATVTYVTRSPSSKHIRTAYIRRMHSNGAGWSTGSNSGFSGSLSYSGSSSRSDGVKSDEPLWIRAGAVSSLIALGTLGSLRYLNLIELLCLIGGDTCDEL